jgi:hypothetical protein
MWYLAHSKYCDSGRNKMPNQDPIDSNTLNDSVLHLEKPYHQKLNVLIKY